MRHSPGVVWTSPLGRTHHTRPQPATTDLSDPVPGPDYPDYTPPATGDEDSPILYRPPPQPEPAPPPPDPDEPPSFQAAAEPTSARAREQLLRALSVLTSRLAGNRKEGGP